MRCLSTSYGRCHLFEQTASRRSSIQVSDSFLLVFELATYGHDCCGQVDECDDSQDFDRCSIFGAFLLEDCKLQFVDFEPMYLLPVVALKYSLLATLS